MRSFFFFEKSENEAVFGSYSDRDLTIMVFPNCPFCLLGIFLNLKNTSRFYPEKSRKV
jgi:hypothetical protein